MRITNPIVQHAIETADFAPNRRSTRTFNRELETANQEWAKAALAWCRDPGNTKLRREATQKRKILEALWADHDGTSATN